MPFKIQIKLTKNIISISSRNLYAADLWLTGEHFYISLGLEVLLLLRIGTGSRSHIFELFWHICDLCRASQYSRVSYFRVFEADI